MHQNTDPKNFQSGDQQISACDTGDSDVMPNSTQAWKMGSGVYLNTPQEALPALQLSPPTCTTGKATVSSMPELVFPTLHRKARSWIQKC